MRLALVADVHMCDADHEAVSRVLEGAVERIRAFGPDRTVVLGDLVQDEDRAADRRNVERVVTALTPLSPRYLAGNHDTASLEPDEIAALVGNDLGGHEERQGVDLVYLDTSSGDRPGARGAVPPSGLRRLSAVLADGGPALVFAHHPLHYRDMRDNAWFGEHPELAFAANKAWVQRRFDHHGGVIATFNGHVHEFHHAVYRGIDHFTITAVNKELPDAETPRGGHALVTLEDDRLRVEAYDRDGFVRAWEVPRERPPGTPGAGPDQSDV